MKTYQFTKCPQCGYEMPREPYEYTGMLRPHLELIKDRVARGRTAREIAKELLPHYDNNDGWFGREESLANGIRALAKKLNLKLRFSAPKKLSDEEKRKILQLRKEGHTLSDLGKMFNRSASRMRDIAVVEERRQVDQAKYAKHVAALNDRRDFPLRALGLSNRTEMCVYYLLRDKFPENKFMRNLSCYYPDDDPYDINREPTVRHALSLTDDEIAAKDLWGSPRLSKKQTEEFRKALDQFMSGDARK